MEISIIIPTMDRGVVFEEALESIVQAVSTLDAEIIVVNDSKISSPAISPTLRNVKLLDNPKSGVASARNLGASVAASEFLIFMDDDFIVPEDCVRKVIAAGYTDPHKIRLFNWEYPPELERELEKSQFGRYLIAHGYTSLKGWLDKEWDDQKEIFELAGGASYFLPMRKSVFREIGGYNENFPHAGAEDFDFIRRAKKAGVTFYVDKGCMLYHNEKDRWQLKNWVARKKRNGESIKVAVDFGHHEIALRYSSAKSILLEVASKLKTLIFLSERLIPNVKGLDALYFKVVNFLTDIYVYDGYTEGKRP
jgi:GT2 family glycosyltransferase